MTQSPSYVHFKFGTNSLFIALKPIINWSESQYRVICTLNLEQCFILAWQRRLTISMVLLHYLWGFQSRFSQSQCACSSLQWLNLTLKEIVMYVSLLTHCGQMNWTETHATTSSWILHFCHRTCTFSSAIHFQQTEEHFLLAVCRCLHTCLICKTKLKLSFKALLYD